MPVHGEMPSLRPENKDQKQVFRFLFAPFLQPLDLSGSHIWPMLAALFRNIKPKNPSLTNFFLRASNTNVEWDR